MRKLLLGVLIACCCVPAFAAQVMIAKDAEDIRLVILAREQRVTIDKAEAAGINAAMLNTKLAKEDVDEVLEVVLRPLPADPNVEITLAEGQVGVRAADPRFGNACNSLVACIKAGKTLTGMEPTRVKVPPGQSLCLGGTGTIVWRIACDD